MLNSSLLNSHSIGFDKLAIGAGLDQARGRPALDKLLMRRNSGSSLRELDLRVGPSRRNHHKIVFGAGLDKAAMAGLDKTAVAP